MALKNLLRKKTIAQITQDIARNEAENKGNLHKGLSLRDLVALGVAAIVGAGIFGTIGEASVSGGPAVSLLFVFTAFACIFSALCYAEFASTIPISGSAYTYAYASFGELVAWIIGWALLMEYAVGNIAVAISWSDYFTGLMSGFGLHIPEYLGMDYFSAARGYEEISALLAEGRTIESLTDKQKEIWAAWQSAPMLGNFRLIIDLPAFVIVVLITCLVYVGIKESRNVSNMLVVLKVLVILMVILVGAFYVNPENWSPFAPNGLGGVLKGVGAVFFAYIGFDAVSTTAEECKNPQRDLPKAMIYAVVICTILYVAIALVLTGMVSYKELGVGDPLAFVFSKVGLDFMAGIVAVSAIFAMTSVLLVFQLGQPRIWMTMSRDGLLPPRFSKIHPRFHTPYFATIITGIVVAIPALFMNLEEVTNLTSIGTLFAFALVCGGVLVLANEPGRPQGRFRVPYYNGKWIVPIGLLGILIASAVLQPAATKDFFLLSNQHTISNLEQKEASLLQKIEADTPAAQKQQELLENNRRLLKAEKEKNAGTLLLEHLSTWLFVVAALLLAIFSFKKNLSAIPVVGLLINLYLMSELDPKIWAWFFGSMLLGLGIYFGYGYRKSKLHRPQASS